MPIDPGTLSGKTLWLRGKDLAGADASAVSAWADQSGGGRSPLSFTNVTVKTGQTPAGGRVARTATGQILLPDLFNVRANQLTATASSEFSSTFVAANAVDGTSSAWVSASNATVSVPQWLRVQQETPVAATSYQILSRFGWSNHAPKDWKFQGSNDGSSWTDLDTRTGQTFSDSTERTFTFSNSTAYTYYRLLVTNTGDGTGPDIENFGLNGVSNVATAGVGELWIVAKSNDTSGGAWMFGSSGQQNHFTFSGTCFSDFGNNTRRSYTPSPSIAGTWRLFRFSIDSSGNLRELIDETLNLSVNGLTKGWRADPYLAYSWTGDIAEAFARGTTSSSGEIADLITYFNTEHGLSVPGGSSGPTTYNGAAALTASSTLTATADPMTRSASATLTATSALTADAFLGSPTVSGSANLTASSVLTANAAAVRSATAALIATTALTADATTPLQAASAALTASATLTASASGAVAQAATAALYAASALFVEASASTAATATLTASTTLTVAATAFTPWVEPNDPRTGKPQYRLIVADRNGTRNGELTNATTSPVEDGVGVGASFGFTAPTADPKLTLIDPPATQVQVWRGTGIMPSDPTPRPVFRGPVVTASQDVNGSTTFQCRDPWWYLESGRRVIGAIPKRDLLVNGSFAGGESPWTGGFEPDSIPAAQPARSVIDVDFFGTRMKALQISGVDKVVTVTQEVKTEAVFVPNSATYLPGGASAIIAVAQKMPKSGTLQVRVDGYTADNRINNDFGDGMQLSKDRADAAKATILGVRPGAVITTAGHGYYNQIPGGQAANRRVVISWNGVQEASGHKQYEAQTLTVTQPVAAKAYLPLTAVIWVKITKWIGPSKDGRGLYLQIVNPAKPAVVVDSGVFNIDEKTPRDRWIRMEASLQNGVPADGIAYQAQVRLYPPAGTALFTRGGLYPGDQLAFFDVDQSLIIKGLVEHAQDTSIGKGALGIGTRCQPTGFTRTREYPYDERMPIETAIKEIAALFEGPEVVMEVTATAQTVVTYHPRQGVATSQVVVHGGNSVAYQAPTDTRDAASSIILQADGSGADREEGYASDAAALDGLMLEQVISTEGETPVTELTEGAQSALASLKHPQPAIWVTVDPRRTGAVLATIGQGDTLRYVNDVAGFDGTFRFVKRRLSFNDVLEMMLTPEG